MTTATEPAWTEPAPGAPLRMVCVVSHTHWDREWYHPQARFRQRLTALIDALLAYDGPASFLLDGQGITLVDYLAIRPEGLAALRAAFGAGRLEAGPWFVLADNLLPSGEAVVRNLEAGRRVLDRMGVVAPRVAYCPDTFGHPAALPLIAAGFGLPVAVVWRGAGGSTSPVGDAFRWHGPDGSSLLTYHLPPDGYEFGSALPTQPAAAAARWQQLSALFDARAATDTVLVLNGADHHARQPDLDAALAAMQHAARQHAAMQHAGDRVTVRAMSLQDWATEFNAAASRRALPTVVGELRDSYGYTWTLGGTLATRAHQKRRNARLEQGLLRDVEPWLALVRLHDPQGAQAVVSRSGRLTMAQLPALLESAWESLLATHPHDTLCGCSVDAVARAMDVQQESVAEQGGGLREAALHLVLAHDPVAARAGMASCVASDGAAPTVVIRNRTARARHGLAWLTLRTTLADVSVGPESANRPGRGEPPPVASMSDAVRALIATGAVQLLGSSRATWVRRESPQHYPDNDLVAEQRVLAWVSPVPAFGLVAGRLDAVCAADMPWPARVHAPGLPQPIVLDNGLLTVAVHADGQVRLVQGDRVVDDALWVESCHDAGDSYTPSPGEPQRLQIEQVRVRDTGPLRASVDIVWTLGTRAAKGRENGTPHGVVRVVTTLHLLAGQRAVSCHVQVRNERTDHRLRLVWRTDVTGGEVMADAAFGPVNRPAIVAPPDSREAVPDGMPLHRWVLSRTAHHAAAIISDGLAEAQVEPRETPGSTTAGEVDTLQVTLLRATGELSRDTIPERPGHAGWPAAVPLAQCQGEFTARVALLLLQGDRDDMLTTLSRATDDLLLPLLGETWRDADLGDRPVRCAGPALFGDGLEASAVTVSHTDARAVVLRAVNLTDHTVTGHWQMPQPGPWSVTPCRLDETPLGETEQHGQLVPITVAPRAVITLRVCAVPGRHRVMP